MDPRDYFINGYLLSGFASAARLHMLNPLELLEKLHISKDILVDPDVVINQYEFNTLINEAAKLTGLEFFGIELSEHFRLESFSFFGGIVKSQTSFASVPIVINLYNDLQSNGAEVYFERAGSLLLQKVRYEFENEIDCRIYKQVSLGVAHRLYSRYADSDYKLKKVYLKYPYEDVRRLEKFFGCPVVAGADFDALELPSDFILKGAKESEGGTIRGEEAFGHMFKENSHLIQILTSVIGVYLPLGICSRESIAKSVGVHYKTLQKVLRNYQTSYAELLKDYRYKQAQKLLKTTDLSITQITLQLGYAETAVFTRSFKKWSGLAPEKWRLQVQQELAGQ